MTKLVIEADGGSRGNPGPAGSGAVILDEAGNLLGSISIYLGETTNNVAEYRAVIAAVELAKDISPSCELIIKMDSKLVVEQMSGRWKVKHENMAELSGVLSDILEGTEASFEWIPREENTRADALANLAMDTESSQTKRFDQSESQVINIGATQVEFNKELPSSVRAPSNITKGLTTLILVRHGRTTLTESQRMSGSGGVDPKLSESGIEDARKVARELSKVGKSGSFAGVSKPTVIVSSPLSRTLETAQVISESLSIPVEVNQNIAEIAFGDWDNHTNAEVAEKWPELYAAWRGDITLSPPNGESVAVFHERVKTGLAEIVSKFEGQTVVVVSHVMPIRGFVKEAIQADWPAYWRTIVSPCSISVLRFWGNESAEISCVNYSGHL